MAGIQSIKVSSKIINADVEFTGAVVRIDEQTIDFGVSNKTIILDNTGDIQTALDELNTAGGGSLYLKAGTYTIASGLTGYSNIRIFGDNSSNTIIDFNSTSSNLSFAGSNLYNTGTITAIAGGVNVTGSGTTWTADMVGRHLFIGTRWYLIAAVTGLTTLILAEGYGDNVTLPASYRIATIIMGVRISELTLKNSTGTALTFTDARDIELENMLFLNNSIGFSLTNISQCNIDALVSVANTSDGYRMTNCGLFNVNALSSQSNGANGATLNNLKTVPFIFSACDGNVGDGFNCTNLSSVVLQVEASGNGGQGVEFVSNCSGNFVTIALFAGNTSDGIKLTATSDGNTIGPNASFTGNGGYGINIANANCDDNIIISPYYAGNASGTLNDSGTGTIIVRGNTYYPGGTDVALADGGTGTSLADPNADRIMFWDDSAGVIDWLIPGTGLVITNKTIDATVLAFKSGTTTKNAADASTTQTIAHGLGVAPKYVRIYAVFAGTFSPTPEFHAETIYDGTTQSSVSVKNGSGPTVSTVTTFTINSANADTGTNGVVTFDATNISIAWTKVGSPTGTFTMLWEVYG